MSTIDFEIKKQKCMFVASFLKALSHPQRMLLLCCLVDGEKSVTELEELCGTSQSVVSQHLSRMRLQGFVSARRDGNFVFYKIADPRVAILLAQLEKLFCGDAATAASFVGVYHAGDSSNSIAY